MLKNLEDAETVRAADARRLRVAESRTDPAEIKRLLTFVIVGGGPTGVELAGAFAELARSTLARDFRHIQPAAARIVLCEAGPRLLGGVSAVACRTTRCARFANLGSRSGSTPMSR